MEMAVLALPNCEQGDEGGTRSLLGMKSLLLHHEIDQFNARYARVLDSESLTEWIEMFHEDALYVVLSRENYDRNLPVGLIYCENKNMIRDRALALSETTMFAPRYLRHLIGMSSVLKVESNGDIRATATYMVAEVLFDRPDARLHQVGVYYDVFRRREGALNLIERKCVYDSLLIFNAMCLPV
jgi:anthranilate 1,2-dioxygenase small subunit